MASFQVLSGHCAPRGAAERRRQPLDEGSRMSTLQLSLMLAGMLGIGFLAQWLAWRVRLPAILFLLLAGILLVMGGCLRMLGQ